MLVEKKICINPSPLQNAYFKPNNSLRVSELKLQFNPADIRNIRPQEKYNELFVILNLSISDIETANNNFNLDFATYQLRLEIHGIDENNSDHMVSWHLDYDKDSNAEFVHPFFHMTFGGSAIEDKNFGDLILLPVPRIPYPPMDAIMAIDFTLANFMRKDIYNKLRSEYAPALQKSQDWILKPYILSISNHWCKFQCAQYISPQGQDVNFLPYLR